LEAEIASRYYFQDGRLESDMKSDPDIKQVVAVLNDPEKYHSILTTIVKSDKPYHSEKVNSDKLIKDKSDKKN